MYSEWMWLHPSYLEINFYIVPAQAGGVAAEQRARASWRHEAGWNWLFNTLYQHYQRCCCFWRCHRLENSSKQSSRHNGKKLIKHIHVCMYVKKAMKCGRNIQRKQSKIAIHFAKFQWNFTFNIQQCYFHFHSSLLVSKKKGYNFQCTPSFSFCCGLRVCSWFHNVLN